MNFKNNVWLVWQTTMRSNEDQQKQFQKLAELYKQYANKFTNAHRIGKRPMAETRTFKERYKILNSASDRDECIRVLEQLYNELDKEM